MRFTRDMLGRYARACLRSTGQSFAPPEIAETNGPGPPAARSLPSPARKEWKHDAGAGYDAGGCLCGPSHFWRVALRFAALRRAERVR